jgi:hypothetical protein
MQLRDLPESTRENIPSLSFSHKGNGRSLDACSIALVADSDAHLHRSRPASGVTITWSSEASSPYATSSRVAGCRARRTASVGR